MNASQAQRPILIIEDDDDIREAIQDALESEGFRIATAVDGRDGLQRLHEIETPCVILLDLMMPIMSGSEFLMALRKSDTVATIPVVIVSAWPDEAAKVREHAQGYVRKPISLDALLGAVLEFCSTETIAKRDAGGGGHAAPER